MRTTTLTIANKIAAMLARRPYALPAVPREEARREAVSQIVKSFFNYAHKNNTDQRWFFAEMIIQILQPEEEYVHFSDTQATIDIIVQGEADIIKETEEDIKQEREAWFA